MEKSVNVKFSISCCAVMLGLLTQTCLPAAVEARGQYRGHHGFWPKRAITAIPLPL